MTAAEKKAREIISKQPLEALLDQWELTSIMNDKNIPTVRGWLMEEFENRNPEAFNNWLDSFTEDDKLRDYMTA